MKKINFSTPDKAFDKFLTWFNFKKRLAFLITFLIGFVTHINMITDYLMSQDGLWNSVQYFKPGDWEITLGRWGIVLTQRLNNFIAIPSITTISCIFVMSIISVIVIDLFNFKNKLSIIFTSALLAVSPVFTVTLLYIYTSLSYTMCMLFSILVIWSIYKIKNKKLGYILASVFFILTMSIYQSYIGISIGLCLMMSIIQLIKKETTAKKCIINIIKIGIIAIISGIIYLLLTKIVLIVLSLELSDYKLANQFSIKGIIVNLKTSIISAYKDFMAFFIRDRIIYNTNYRRDIFYILFFVSTAVVTIRNVFKNNYNEKKEKILNIICIAILVMCLPIALNIIDLLIIGNETYALTASQLILVVPFCLALIEENENLRVLEWISCISIICVIGTYFIADYASYTALKLTYNQAYSTTERIIDRIESTPGYNKDYPIVFGGIVGNNNFPRTSNIYNYTIGSIVNNTTFHGTYGGQVGTWMNFIKIYFGLDIVPCEANLYYTIVNSEDYKEMGIFPDQNSIKIKDGIIIVKLNETPPLPF